MGDKSVETLGNKTGFLSILVTFSPFPQNNVDFSISSTAQTTAPTQHWTGGPGGIRELTLEANKIEQMLKYRKASFPKGVSTTFVAHCSLKGCDYTQLSSCLFSFSDFKSSSSPAPKAREPNTKASVDTKGNSVRDIFMTLIVVLRMS